MVSLSLILVLSQRPGVMIAGQVQGFTRLLYYYQLACYAVKPTLIVDLAGQPNIQTITWNQRSVSYDVSDKTVINWQWILHPDTETYNVTLDV